MKVIVDRSKWALSGTLDIPGNPQCIGSYLLNALGFQMDVFKELENEEYSLIGNYYANEICRICEKHGFDEEFTKETSNANDNKDEDKLIKLLSEKGFDLEFIGNS